MQRVIAGRGVEDSVAVNINCCLKGCYGVL